MSSTNDYGTMQAGSQISVPPVSQGVLRLLVLFVTAFVLEVIAGFMGINAVPLALHFGQNFHPAQILTHIFVSDPGPNAPFFSKFMSVLFDGIILYGFGTQLEMLWGRRHFLRYFLICLLGGLATWGLVHLFISGDFPIWGYSAGISGMLIAFAVIWPDRQILFMFVIPLRMKWLILILLVMLIALGQLQGLILYSGGALAGALYLFYHARRGRVMAENPRGFQGSTRSSSISGGIGAQHLHEKESGGITGWWKDRQKKKRLRKKQEEIDRRISMKEEVDRLLQKISEEGMDSLTRKEKAFLDQASREF
ncbi:MAG: rhomboid family intramembrane serine protease [Leptospiraceae bacterium]|nr:rhomboid family intramembrane serine protease [Leptospiraceae bacterium]